VAGTSLFVQEDTHRESQMGGLGVRRSGLGCTGRVAQPLPPSTPPRSFASASATSDTLTTDL